MTVGELIDALGKCGLPADAKVCIWDHPAGRFVGIKEVERVEEVPAIPDWIELVLE